jgi:hypothetical protein
MSVVFPRRAAWDFRAEGSPVMSSVSGVYSKIRARLTESRARRDRKDLITRIGELTYAQRTDPAAGYDTEIERLVEEVRHLERMQELRNRREIADG